MKKLAIVMLMLVAMVATASAQKQAKITFEQTEIDLGTFAKNTAQKATFTFTNTGNAPLVLNQVVASCGCTVPHYDKKPIMPGQKGYIAVTFHGKNLGFPGKIKKSITIRSNAVNELTRVYIKGVMK